MSKMHKIGGHVLSEHRNGWGDVAPQMVCCVSLQEGAFDELPDRAIKVWRTQSVPQHTDIGEGINDHGLDKQYEIGKWWWPKCKPYYEKVYNKFKDKNVYIQPINEVKNPRTPLYMHGMMDAAHKDGFKLALFGDAGLSPDWDDWVKDWVPVIKAAEAQGHIYCRHAYAGATSTSKGDQLDYLTWDDGSPRDIQSSRPFKEAEYLLKNNIATPIIIGELGWHGGHKKPGYHWMADLERYNKLMMEYDNIIGGALWTWGNWDTNVTGNSPNLGGEPTAELNKWMKKFSPKFYNFSVKPKKPTEYRFETKTPNVKVEEPQEKIDKKEEKGDQGQSKVGGAVGQTNDQAGSDKNVITNQKQQNQTDQTFQPPVNFGQGSLPVTTMPPAGGIAAHLTALIYQLAALGLSSANILQRAISGTVQPLTHELRMNYGGQQYLVQLAQAGGEWRAYYSPAADPLKVSMVSTGQGVSRSQEPSAPAVVQEVSVKKEGSPLPKRDEAVAHVVASVDQAAVEGQYLQEKAFELADETLDQDVDLIDLTKENANGSIMLNLPFRSQNGQGARQFGGDCGPTCVTMVIEAVQGLRVDPDELMVKLDKTSKVPRENWTDFTHLERALNWYGVQGEHKQRVQIADMEAALAKGHPVVSLIHYGSLEKSARNTRIAFDGWHFIALLGYDDSNFYFHDPLQDQETVSKTTKEKFHKAAGVHPGINTPNQIMVVTSKGNKGVPKWVKNLPTGFSFLPAVGDRATKMKEPVGKLTKAWVYTGEEDKPSMIRKGKLVEVKTGHLNARLGPGKENTLLKQVFPGQTMVLTNHYHNGYTQVQLNLGEEGATSKVNGQAGVSGLQSGAGSSIDLKDYFFAEPGKQIMVKHPDGNSEKFLTKDLGGGWYLMQKNNKWELWKVDDKFIYLVDDVSPADDSGGTKRFYRVRKTPESDKLTPYCKRYMKIGEEYGDGGHNVQFHRISNGHKLDENSGSASNYFKFLGKGEAIKTLNGQDTLEDVIHVKGGTEEHWFAKGLGRIAWNSKWGQSKIEEIIKNHQEPPKVHLPKGYKLPEGVAIDGVKMGDEGF